MIFVGELPLYDNSQNYLMRLFICINIFRKINFLYVICLILKMSKRPTSLQCFILLVILISTTSALDFRNFKLSVLQSLETQFFVEDQSNIKCNPCRASIEITDEAATALIKTSNGTQIKSQFQVHNSFFGFQLFSYNYISQRQEDKTITEYIDRKASFGMQWNFLFYLPEQQIRLKLTIQRQNFIQLPAVLMIMLVLMSFIFPLKKQQVNRMKTQMAYRTNIFSLTLTSFLAVTIILYIVNIFGLYIINGENAIYIFIAYFVFLGIMSLFMIHAVSVIKVWAVMLFKKVSQNKIIRSLISIVLVLLFLGQPFLLAFFDKGQIFLFLTTLPIIIQLIHSVVMMDYPYWPYLLFTSICTITLMFLQAFYPIFHFNLISNFAAIRILILIGLELTVTYLVVKTQVPFQEVCQLVADQATVGVVTAPSLNSVQMNNQAKSVKSFQQLNEQK